MSLFISKEHFLVILTLISITFIWRVLALLSLEWSIRKLGTLVTTLTIRRIPPIPIPVRKITVRVPAVFAGIIIVLKTKIRIRIVLVRIGHRRGGGRRRRCYYTGGIRMNMGTQGTTLTIAATTNPFPIPERKIIGTAPTVFVRIIFVLETKILTRIVHWRGRRWGERRRRRWSGWRCWAHWTTTIIAAISSDVFPIPNRKNTGRVPTVVVITSI